MFWHAVHCHVSVRPQISIAPLQVALQFSSHPDDSWLPKPPQTYKTASTEQQTEYHVDAGVEERPQECISPTNALRTLFLLYVFFRRPEWSF